MIDGLFLYKLKEDLNADILESKIIGVDQLNKTDFCLSIRSNYKNLNLFLSLGDIQLMFLTRTQFEKPIEPTPLTMFLRKRLIGSIIKEIEIVNSDRVLNILLESHSDFKVTYYHLLIELIGRYANLVLLDTEGKVLEVLKPLSPIDSKRPLFKGITYIPLNNYKIPYLEFDQVDKAIKESTSATEVTEKVSGLSSKAAKYIIENSIPFKDFLSSYSPTLKEDDFYFSNIFEGKQYENLYSLQEEFYFAHKESKSKSQESKIVIKTIHSNIKRLEKKITLLESEKNDSNKADNFKIKGELLLSSGLLDKKLDKISVFNYYTGENIEIDLDSSKTVKTNSNDFYKKYKKLKSAAQYIDIELSKARDELEYFNTLKEQCEHSSIKDFKEIENELISLSYIHHMKVIIRKSIKPNILRIEENGCVFLVGKNNLQNDYLTHKVASKDDLFFHVKDYHGSHVILKGENKYSETSIRRAAMLAKEYSSAFNSESVEVYYTEVRNIKKIPQIHGSKVLLNKKKSIFI